MINNEHDQLLREDAYLIHPLQHRSDHGEPMICARAEGTTLFDTEGHQYIDGLSGLWNVNVGHGRHELAKTAADQIVQNIATDRIHADHVRCVIVGAPGEETLGLYVAGLMRTRPVVLSG